MGPEPNVLHSAVRISSVTFLNCSVVLNIYLQLNMSVLSLSLSLRAIMCNRPGTADACFTNRIRCLVCGGPNCVKLHLAVWLSGGNITD
jgi:hypothetical protein